MSLNIRGWLFAGLGGDIEKIIFLNQEQVIVQASKLVTPR